MFIGMCTVLVQPSFLTNEVIFKLITCTYAGAPGFPGPGVTWFVFTLMWLYFIAPILGIIFNRCKHVTIIFFIVLFLGAFNRYLWYINEWPWLEVYTSPLCNIDIFTCGFSIAYMKDRFQFQKNKFVRCIIISCFITLIMFNNYMIAYGKYMELYQYGFASAYLFFTCLYLYIFRVDSSDLNKRHYFQKCLKSFCSISFEFYLFHTLIFERLSRHIGGHTVTEQYIKFFVITFVITYLFAFGWHRLVNYHK